MKQNIILLFLLFVVGLIKAQTSTDVILYESGNRLAAGAYTIDQLRTYITAGLNSGTVTSVGISVPTGLTATGSPVTTSGTLGFTVNMAAGVVKSTGIGGNLATSAVSLTSEVTGVLPLANGGTGQSSAAAAITALTGTQTANYVLASNGTNATLQALTNAMLPVVDASHGGTGVAGTLTGYVYANGTGAMTASTTIPGASVSGAVASATTATTAGNVTGVVAIANGGTGSTTAAAARTALAVNLQNVTTEGGSTTVPSTFSGGLTSSGKFVASDAIVNTLGAQITSTTTFAATNNSREINATTAITVSIASGNDIGTVITLPLSVTSTGAVTINSTASETFNGGASFVVAANSQGTTITLRKVNSTNYRASLGW